MLAGKREGYQKIANSSEVELSALAEQHGQRPQPPELVIRQGEPPDYQSLSASSSSSSSLPSVELSKNNTCDTFPISPSNDSNGGGHGHCGPPGTATTKQVAVNIFVSFVGSGILGLPYAFSQSGWLLGPIALLTTSIGTVYAMLLLVQTRKRLESMGHEKIFGYGDVGRLVAGSGGEMLVNFCLVLSQLGFGTAYIIFVAANLYNIANINRALTCLLCVPVLAIMVQFQDMKKLSPFSLFADVANVVGLSAVLFQDYENYPYRVADDLVAFNFSQLVYVTSVSIYSLEGICLVLPLESSYQDREKFPSLLKKVLCGISALMIIFGCCGYYAFGSSTEAPITLNLEGQWVSVVKLCLCVGLYLTFPVMIFPVNEVMEDFFLTSNMPRPNRIFRTMVVIFSATIAYAVPDFGKFLSLVGASTCTILGFILPCYFHLVAFGRKELTNWEIFLDFFIIVIGILFGVLGTYQSLMDILGGHDDNDESASSGSRALNSILTL